MPGAETGNAWFCKRLIDLCWRDLDLLRQSPFLTETQNSEGWPSLEHRIRSQLEIQNRLVSQSSELEFILSF